METNLITNKMSNISEKERQAIDKLSIDCGIEEASGVWKGAMLLAELRNAEKPSEDLINAIVKIINSETQNLSRLDWNPKFGLSECDYKKIATRIANLVTQREADLLPLWQLKKVQNALRLTNNIHDCHKKATAYDRIIIEALGFCNNAIEKHEKL